MTVSSRCTWAFGSWLKRTGENFVHRSSGAYIVGRADSGLGNSESERANVVRQFSWPVPLNAADFHLAQGGLFFVSLSVAVSLHRLNNPECVGNTTRPPHTPPFILVSCGLLSCPKLSLCPPAFTTRISFLAFSISHPRTLYARSLVQLVRFTP